MFQPIYHKSNNNTDNCTKNSTHFLPKNISFIKDNYQSKTNNNSISSPILHHTNSLKLNRIPIKENKESISNKVESQSQKNSPRVKSEHYKRIDTSKIKAISFDKTSGRENKLAERRKTALRYVSYSPNYDFIREDPTKTCKCII